VPEVAISYQNKSNLKIIILLHDWQQISHRFDSDTFGRFLADVPRQIRRENEIGIFRVRQGFYPDPKNRNET